MEPPLHPIGVYEAAESVDSADQAQQIAEIAALPLALADAVAGLDDGRLDTMYRRWTIRQIVHHLADSHMNAVVRCRWALTQDQPAIKPYNETRWAELPDARTTAIEPSLGLLRGLHARWAQLFESLDADQWGRTFFHPEGERIVRLDAMPGLYAWHGRHHTAQIVWRRRAEGW